MHLAMSGARNSGISTGAATRRLWRRVQKYPKVPRYCFFCEGVYFLARTRVGTAAARCVSVWIVGGSGPSGPGRAKFFQFIPVLHRVSVLSGAQKSSTGSNLRYTRCLDLQYPVRTGTPDPRFTRFTRFTWYPGTAKFCKSQI